MPRPAPVVIAPPAAPVRALDRLLALLPWAAGAALAVLAAMRTVLLLARRHRSAAASLPAEVVPSQTAVLPRRSVQPDEDFALALDLDLDGASPTAARP
ncbi:MULTISPECIES: hypothetical protein [Ramlibacter]|uniref:Uncharacterized protein n=1 Tax=Ramlibacter pinisoli TaxID=2682844 RepID=A0A6N8IRC3_9BURK|nr:MULTISPECIES: hypothetical protein [Ramlibacter]MBA2964432.1 hypothetical protein [Ramlibacter sp. CGMCC 1.13660]MVQ29398.1 hypothetical protein [Ramlibacter pinisoli]